MRLELLAKDAGSGEQGCPSVHVDRDPFGRGGLLVQGDEAIVVPRNPDGIRTVRLATYIVVEALRAEGVEVPDGDYRDCDLTVTGEEVPIENFPNPLPGERVVRATVPELLAGVVDRLTDRVRRDAEAAAMAGHAGRLL